MVLKYQIISHPSGCKGRCLSIQVSLQLNLGEEKIKPMEETNHGSNLNETIA